MDDIIGKNDQQDYLGIWKKCGLGDTRNLDDGLGWYSTSCSQNLTISDIQLLLVESGLGCLAT